MPDTEIKNFLFLCYLLPINYNLTKYKKTYKITIMIDLARRIRSVIKNPPPVSAAAEDPDLPTDEDLVRASALLTQERNFRDLVSIFVGQAQDISRVDMAAFYVLKDTDDRKSDLKLAIKKGRYDVPETISGNSELVCFIRDCKEALIFNNNETSRKYEAFMKEVIINPEMKSGMALPIVSFPREIGILFVGARTPCFFNRRRFHFLDAYTKLAAGALQTSLLFGETRAQDRKIDSLERYQENVFNSMTNMIVTTDAAGQIYYFNEPAEQAMGLTEEDLGSHLENAFRNSLSSRAINAILKSLEDGDEILGLEGIYRRGENELDYSLNVTPLITPRGKKEGLTLLFTNQTREKELKKTVKIVNDERRVVKDMFARYMSQEVMTSLMENPDSIKLGGDKRTATVFFADIRGYTSFSEGRDPEVIVEILKEEVRSLKPYLVKILEETGYVEEAIRQLSNRNVEVRREAAAMLSLLDTLTAFRGLVMAAKDPDHEVRICVVRALEKLKGSQSYDFLEKLKQDPDSRVRKYTHWALERLDSLAME
jgi:PAS domain S-box-containing protein